ncbi:hypothetical protein MSG28_008916 [Choristoneura fumiferana]|uniref:Uncharacterized protein n=1 Tax=Choristoneura fumiferana TaxID=7141 RepID=A0ACC0J8H9_CHOFU|nr:hypothetical protein MSG28_008916 [Choristoneura fumiferana]
MLFLDYLLDLYSVSRQEDVIEDNACGGQIILAAVLSVALAQVPGYRYQPTQYQAYQARPRSFEGNAAILRSDAEASKPKSQARRQTVSKLQAATPTLATMARSTKCGTQLMPTASKLRVPICRPHLQSRSYSKSSG